MIRTATPGDAPAMLAIYAPHVAHGAATFETEVPSLTAMRERIETRMRHYPWLVWEESGQVLAYAYAGRFRERAAYDWITETSIYVDPAAQRRGIARRLYGALFDVLRRQGFTQAMGVITLPGAASVALHEALDFVPAGRWRDAGYKLGRWWNVGVWQKTLAPSTTPPPAPVPFADLRKAV